jgi:hypothetical protein
MCICIGMCQTVDMGIPSYLSDYSPSYLSDYFRNLNLRCMICGMCKK